MNKPKHPKTGLVLRQKLFDGLSRFRELEDCISALPAELRGDAFEVFAEAYLATQPTPQAKQVWPFDVIPPSLKDRLALGRGRDMGVDGVFETRLGDFNAYQAKFRTGRTSLTWQELSTFMGLSDQVSERVLFTNCDDLPAVLNQRKGFYCIRGSDLDKLERRDFEAISAWLQGAVVPREKKSPQPHQQEALDHILPALEKHDRATAIMACGTGKTLIALWVAENVGRFCEAAKTPAADSQSRPTTTANILVLVPSLALLRQTLHEWLRETSWQDFAYLCVCSDPTVNTGTDELIVRQSDLDFPVTTDAEVLCRFLVEGAAPAAPKVKIVFSTYQSAPVVAAGTDRGFAFDLAIFDEAHKTAGREGRHFGFALDDKNLPICKRLFLTATPRHYDVRKRDKEGDAIEVYSMDVPELYGPVAHTLTFAEAARRDIICNYKVIISVVTSDMINDHLLKHGKVLVAGGEIQARQVANQLALKAAVEIHGVSKIFTFHRTVASAKSFVSPVAALAERGGNSGEGVGNHLPDFATFHVNGTMPTAERDGLMGEFRAASKAVMSNARCLTEGVDVPAVDMVAFLTPKRSKVDIVQATGRAMRKAGGKTTGYILVPLFVEQAKGESVDEAIARAEFDEVWNVLQAMQEQDEVLADIIRRMREERGRTRGFDEARFRDTVEVLGPAMSLELLRYSITAACVDKFGISWDERYGELQAFKEEFGHCNVPFKWHRNPQLSSWIFNQRQNRKMGRLSEDRVRRLDEIGFVWDQLDQDWEEMFAGLVAYKSAHGNCNVPYAWKENRALSVWVNAQRMLKREGKFDQVREDRLSSLGFMWEVFDNRWERMFSALVRYKQVHGSCNVSAYFKEHRQLGLWTRNQRNLRKRGQLPESRARRLDEIGFIWDPLVAKWESQFASLLEYKRVRGDCNVPANGWDSNPELGQWVMTQRSRRREGKVSEDRIRRLDEIGFIWDPLVDEWNRMFAALLEYKRMHGHCNAPSVWPPHPSLGIWLCRQRTFRKKGILSAERIQKLEEVGILWDTKQAQWDEMFAALMAAQGAARPLQCAGILVTKPATGSVGRHAAGSHAAWIVERGTNTPAERTRIHLEQA